MDKKGKKGSKAKKEKRNVPEHGILALMLKAIEMF